MAGEGDAVCWERPGGDVLEGGSGVDAGCAGGAGQGEEEGWEHLEVGFGRDE